ncbi:HlyD family type I secretion periplasmic adaptor subunit [Nitrosospira briensis]|uniref:HlyD family type I secretion periplasmic adaptor subunit n=1 Tax=Nitrosospira briensis TaxID=35799 RepID=UPI0008ECC893|nr:HlyD family type I secretion periplasmic adaptor subunit [Nitrosospira briensis]SFO22462.1 membrane fusion protein, protease secretion system [Nitrosospira briensis]
MEMKLQSSGSTYGCPQESPLSGVDSDAVRYIRLGWGVVIAGIGGFLLWASLAPLDKGVPLSGTVTVATSRKAIQHQTGGTIEDIFVKDGDVVDAGAVLVRMNSVQVKANAETTRVQYFAARAAEARLIAEREGKKTIVFPAELEKMKNDPIVFNYIAMQQHLFSSRLSGIQSELSAMDESISGLKLQTSGLEKSRDNKKQQLEFLQEQLGGMRDLASEGYVARNRLLELERMYAQISGAMSEDIGNVGRGQRQIAELKLRRIQRQQEYQKEVRSQLPDVQKEAEMLAHKLSGHDHDLGNVLIKAPVDGTVVGLNVFTRGGVIAPGFKMMDIVPRDDPLMVEGRLPVHLIDKVHPDLPVELIFTAFNRNLTPHMPGIVTQVSADRFVDENTGEPYYKLHAKVAPEGIKMIAGLQIKPGMPVDLFVKTGERTMMNYILKPILDHLKMAMTED